jgi:hypothetical protein
MYYKFTFNKYNFLLTRPNYRDLALIGNETSNFRNIKLGCLLNRRIPKNVFYVAHNIINIFI